MSANEAPRKTQEEIKAELDAMLASVAVQAKAEAIDLPSVLGEYRAIAGRPGWYVRPMRLRQQMRMAELTATATGSTEAAIRGHVVIGSLLLYRVSPPGADLRAWVEGIANSTAFVPATADEVLDTFSLEQLNAEVLRPMGFGWEPDDAAEPDAGNAPAP